MVINRGLWFALAAFGLWGFFPIYWRLLSDIPANELIAHRIVWSMVFIALIIALQKRWPEARALLKVKGIFLTLFISSILIACNWLVFIWAINNHFILEASLGYFITPLFNVLLGVVILKEHLRKYQALSILMATAGVLYLTIHYGRFPWIAITLALSFACYGLIRKTAKIGSLLGLGLETAILMPPAVLYMSYLEATGQFRTFDFGLGTQLLVYSSGIVTAIPLLCFTEGARRLNLTTIGLMQYIAPSLQFLQAVFLFDEPFSQAHLYTFAAIWSGLVIFSIDSIQEARRKSRLQNGDL